MKPIPTGGCVPSPIPSPLEGHTGLKEAGEENDGGSPGAAADCDRSSSSMMLNREPFATPPAGPGIAAGRGEGGAGHCFPDLAAAASTRLRVCRWSATCDRFFDSRRARSEELADEEGTVGADAEVGSGGWVTAR